MEPHNVHAAPNFYGAVTVGERGQVVIPQAAREAMEIKPGDKILVLSGPRGSQGLMMIKAEAVSMFMAKFTEKMNGLEKMLKESLDKQDEE